MRIWGGGTNLLPLGLRCHLELRRKGGWSLGLRREGGNHVEMERQMLGEQPFAGPSLTMGHAEDCDQAGLARLLPVCYTWFILSCSQGR